MKTLFQISAFLLLVAPFGCQKKKTIYYTNPDNILDIEKEVTEGVTGEPIPFEFKPIQRDSLIQPVVVPLGIVTSERGMKNVKPATSPNIKVAPNDFPSVELKLFTVKDSLITPEPKIRAHKFPDFALSQEPNYKDNAYYNIQYLDGDQGLGTSYIWDIVEDKRGNLWFATWANGVVRFDGFHFYFYDGNWGLPSDYIWNILEDKKGNLWFCTDGSGLNCYDGNSLSHIEVKDGLLSNVIFRAIEDSKGILWFATPEGVNYFNGENFYSLTTEDGLPSNQINALYEDSQGRIWIGTEDGLCYIENDRLFLIGANEGLIATDISSIFEDEQENIWIGTYSNGVIQFDGYSFFNFTTEHGLVNNIINDIITDDYGNVWIATEGGVCMYNHMEFVHFSENEGLSNNLVRTMLQDSDGNLWFGTYGGGINKFNENSFENFYENRGLKSPIVRSIDEDRDGGIWLAHSEGLTVLNGKEMTHYDQASGLSSSIVRCVMIDSKGGKWIGMNSSGASYFDGETFTHYNTESGLSADMILCIYEDTDSNVWFGTYGEGVTMFDGDDFYHIRDEDGLGNNTIRTITQDPEGNMWFGTLGGGAAKLNKEGITRITTNEGLRSNYVVSFHAASNGDMWFGTEGTGLTIMRPDSSVHHIIQRTGLSNDIIWSMLEDPNGSIWVSTEEGLNVITESDSSDYQIIKFGKLDGLKGLDFYPNAVCLDNQNRIWWGSGKSLVMLDLNKYESRAIPPKIGISNIEIDQTILDFRKMEDSISDDVTMYLDQSDKTPLNKISYTGVEPFTNLPQDLVLPYDFNSVTIHFAGIDWSAPHKIKYQYKLDGLDKSWSPLRTDKKAVLGNLSSGDYTFRVRAIGEAKIWSEEDTFSFTILAPWYITWWAFLLYVVLFFVFVYAFFLWRTRSLRENKEALEVEVGKRTIEVVQQKEIVELKNKEITDSINYAKRIQTAILPTESYIKSKLPESFILYMPKDIVAGDFYWVEESNNKMLIAAADCTGHGVPGAMVSVVCNNALNRTIREFNLDRPDYILNKVRDLVIDAFSHSEEDIKDGMDIALIAYDADKNHVEYAGANNNLYLIRNGKLNIFKADKQPIGKYMLNKDYTNHNIELMPGDTIYIFTDGYADQFGGPNGKKYKYRAFSELLLSIQHLKLKDQKKAIAEAFNNWKGDLDQLDDVCIIGMRV